MKGGGAHENARVWSSAETRDLVRLHARYGSKWQCLGQVLGRSGDSVRNKYKRITKAPKPDVKPQLCRMCGQPRRGHVCFVLEQQDGLGMMWNDAAPLALPVVPREDLCQDVERVDENVGLDWLMEYLCVE